MGSCFSLRSRLIALRLLLGVHDSPFCADLDSRNCRKG
jgi:hypothetical protein